MKIAILSPFYPFRGGIAQFSDSLFCELKKSCEVKAFSFDTLYPKILFPGKSQTVPNAAEVDMIESDRVLSSVNPATYKKTANAINNYHPDVLIVAYWMFFFAPAYRILCKFLKPEIKVVALVHNAISHEGSFFDKPLAKWFFKRCDAFIVMSEYVKRDILSLVPKANIMLSPHPIYNHYGEKVDRKGALETLGMQTDRQTILFFGLIRDYKGLDLLIEATKYLSADFQIIIAGECYGSFEKYEKLIKHSPISQSIKVFQQYIPDHMVNDLFSVSDLLVLPYRSATQSGVVALAYHFDMPMVATNVGGLGKMLVAAKTGIVTDDISPEGVAKAIKQYFKEDKQLYINNIKKEKERLSWTRFAEKLTDFCASL